MFVFALYPYLGSFLHFLYAFINFHLTDICLVRDSSAVRRLFVRLARAVGRQSALHKKNSCNSGSAHFHVSWLSDFIFYPKPLYKSLHQSFFYSFITILPSESGVTLHYSTITVPNCAAVFSTLHIVFVILPNNESLINTIFGNSACEIYTLR